MSKITNALFFFFLLSTSVCMGQVKFLKGWNLEFQTAYFTPNSNTLREIYSPHWIDFQLELAKSVATNFEVFASAGYIQRTGESTFTKDSTRFRIIPFGLGFKYYLPSCWSIKPYAGVGFNYRYLNIYNSSEFVKEHVAQGKFGSTFLIGLKKECANRIYYDFFAHYILQNFRFSSSSDYPVTRNDICFDGFKIGVGVGYAF